MVATNFRHITIKGREIALCDVMLGASVVCVIGGDPDGFEGKVRGVLMERGDNVTAYPINGGIVL